MFTVTVAGQRFRTDRFTLWLCANEVRLDGQRIPQDANRPFLLLLEAEPERTRCVVGALPMCHAPI